jgi:hypothetical protein
MIPELVGAFDRSLAFMRGSWPPGGELTAEHP